MCDKRKEPILYFHEISNINKGTKFTNEITRFEIYKINQFGELIENNFTF